MHSTAILSEASLARELTPEGLQRLHDLMLATLHPAGDVIVREGEPGDTLFVLLSGRAGVFKRAGVQRDWAREEQIAILEPGQCFGEMAVIEAAPRSASVRALTPCSVLSLSISGLEKLRHEDPDAFATVVLNIARVLAARLRVANMAMKEFSPGELRALLSKHR